MGETIVVSNATDHGEALDFPSGNSTIVTVRQDHGSSTQVTGPVTMWAQPILVEVESSELSLFVPATTTAPSPSSETVRSSSTTRYQSTEATTASATNLPSSSGLSTGAKAEIGVGAGIGALGTAALIAAIFLFRRRKQSKPRVEAPSTAQQANTGGPFSQTSNLSQPGHFQYPSTYHSTDIYSAELNGNKDHPGKGGVPPAELEGRH